MRCLRSYRALRLGLLLAAVGIALSVAGTALAHPLGNFTVNRHSELALSGDRVYVKYVLDLAEIPTFRAREQAEDRERYADALAERIRSGLVLSLDGRHVELGLRERAIAFPEGQGGLVTTRFEAVFETAPLGGGEHTLTYRDGNEEGAIGWKEVVASARDGAKLVEADVPAESRSGELRRYPEDLLESPLDVTAASLRFMPGGTPGAAPRAGDGSAAAERFATPAERGFEALVGERELSVGFVLVAIFVAMFWGAAHALSPGHGKGVVAAYLVGTRGTPRHAVYLGVIVTVTHTLGVFLLGLVTLGLSELIVPERLYPWLNLVSALLVMAVGIAVLRQRLARWVGTGSRSADHRHDHDHDHDHAHDHHHGHDHHHDHRHGHGAGSQVELGGRAVRLRVRGTGSGDGAHVHARAHRHGIWRHHDHGDGAGHGHAHVPEPGSGLRGLVGVGVASGIVPCPTALVVLLAAISLHRVGFGLLLIVAFSVGLAATMTAIGLLAVWGKGLFARSRLDGRAIRLLPAVSALAIVALGLVMTARAIPGLA